MTMKIQQLNHVALQVSDIDRSCTFYSEVMGLEQIRRPAFGFPGAWFRIGVDAELHLIARDGDFPADQVTHANHFAMKIDSAEAAVTQRQQRGAVLRGPNVRPDGATQIFLADPDGHVIELCTAVP